MSTTTAASITRQGTRCASRPKHASERARLCRSHDRASPLLSGHDYAHRVGGSRFLEVDPIEGGSANDYDYANADPINGLDLSGTINVKGGGGSRCQRGAADCARMRAARQRAASARLAPKSSCFICIGTGPGRAARWAARRVDVSANVCVIACVAVGFQGGNLNVQRGIGLAVGGGLNVGIASREYKDRACSTVNGFYGPAYVTGNGETIRDSEIGGSLGLGFGVVEMKSFDGTYCTSET